MNRKRRALTILMSAATLIGGFAVAEAVAGRDGGAAAATTPPIVGLPSGGRIGAAEGWSQFAICVSKATGRHVSVGRAPNFGIQMSGPAHPYASEDERKAFMTRLRAAQSKCGRLLFPATGDVNSPAFEAKFRDAMLKVAACMRARGINVGDPLIKRHSGGGYTVSWPHGPAVSTRGFRWNATFARCRSYVTAVFANNAPNH